MKALKPFLTGLVLVAALATSCATAYAATAGQQNAVRDAREYLGTQAFSFKGLISQLKFDGFTASQAKYGAKHVHANWNKEAAADAREYLQTQAFSRRGLIEQLEFDGFTPAQAAHGAKAAGL